MKPFLLSLIILASIVFQTVGVSAHHSPPNNEHPPRTALNMGTATGCHRAVEGKMPSAKGLVQNAVQALAQSVAHTCANEIGGFYVDNDVDIVSHKLLHAALGAGLGAAVSKNRTEGAIVGAGSAMAAEIIAEMMGPSVDDLQSKAHAGTLTHDDIETYWEQVNDTANAARLLTAGAVALTGKDTETAVTTSNNALDNNFLEAAYAATQAHDKPLTEERRQAGEEFLFDDIELLQSLKEAAEGPARDRIEYALDRLQQEGLNPLEVPGLIALLKSSAEEFIAAQFIPTTRFDVALEGASLATLGMSKVLPMGMKLLRTLQSEKAVVRALSSFTSRTSARVGLRGAEHAGGKVAHLASPSEFGAKFKKSVRFDLDGEIVRPGNVVDRSSFSPGSHIAPLERKGRVMFDGVEFRAVRDLGHMSDVELKKMMKTGKNPSDKLLNRLDGHHHQQQYHRDPGSFIVEIPKKNHLLSNSNQHPNSNIKGGGLTAEQRQDWNKTRVAFNKEPLF